MENIHKKSVVSVAPLQKAFFTADPGTWPAPRGSAGASGTL